MPIELHVSSSFRPLRNEAIYFVIFSVWGGWWLCCLKRKTIIRGLWHIALDMALEPCKIRVQESMRAILQDNAFDHDKKKRTLKFITHMSI